MKNNIADSTYANFNADLAYLKHLNGVTHVEFISKKEALKDFVKQDTINWEHVLEMQPCAFEVIFEKEWTEKELAEMKNSILENIHGVEYLSNFSHSFRKDPELYFLQYKRIKK